MPLFKVLAAERTKRVLVLASTLNEVEEKAREKLQLPDGSYHVVLEEDGTEIDDDEVLLEVGQGPNRVTLMLLSAEQEWKRCTLDQQSTDGKENKKKDSDQVETNGHAPTLTFSIGENVWNRIPQRLKDYCIAEVQAIPSDRRAMVSILADYMRYELKDVTRTAAGRIAKHISGKYPKTFGDRINGDIVGDGYEILKTQIYNSVNYKGEQDQAKNVRASVNSDDEVDETEDDDARKKDEYGCVDYQPLLPDTESSDSQERKRLELQTLHASEDPKNVNQISELMGDTYPTQRLAINARRRTLEELIDRWPFLSESTYLIGHGSRLVGKDLQLEWNNYLEEKASVAVAFFKSNYRRTERKRGSNKEPTAAGRVAIKGLEILNASKQSTISERSAIPATAVIFPLLVNHLKEEADMLYKVYPDVIDDAELKKTVGPTPILIIQGQSFYDGDAKYIVMVDNAIVRARSLFDGMLTVIVAYYVFGYAYPEKACKCLEFFQRVFLGINPKKGNKRAGKKRQSVSFDSKVFKLSNEIESFKNDIL